MILAAGRGDAASLDDATPKPDDAGGKRLSFDHEALVRAGLRFVIKYPMWRASLAHRRRARWASEYAPRAKSRRRNGRVSQCAALLGKILLVGERDIHGLRFRAVAQPVAGTEGAPMCDDRNPPHHRAGDFALTGAIAPKRRRFTFSGIGVYRLLFAGMFEAVLA